MKTIKTKTKSTIKSTVENMTEDILGFIKDFNDGQITKKELDKYIKSITRFHITNVANEQAYIVKNFILNSID